MGFFEHGGNTNGCGCPIGNCDCDSTPATPAGGKVSAFAGLDLKPKRKAKMTDKEKIKKLEADVAAYVAELKSIKKLVAPKASSFVVWDPKWTENLKELVQHAQRVDEDYVQDRILGNQHGTASLRLLNVSLLRLKQSWR